MAIEKPTSITYGNVQIINVLTREFRQEPVFDELSGTDLICYKFTIRVGGYVNNMTTLSEGAPGGGQAAFGILPTTGGKNAWLAPSASDQMNQLRQFFSIRQPFQMTVGNYVVLRVLPANVLGQKNISGFDCKNGPRCNVLNIDRISGDTSYHVELEFELYSVICDSAGGTQNNSGVLNNRWSCVDDLDTDFNTTRTTSGLLRCSSSMVNPNSFRYLVVPPLQMGMRRDSMQFAVSEDGLNLRYTIVDKEIHFSAPFPATTWSLRVTERRDVTDIFWFTDVEVMLRGDRQVDRKLLISMARAIADAKFSGGNPNAGNFNIMSISIADEYTMSECAIYLNATARRVDGNGPAVLGMQAKWIGVPIVAKDFDAVPNKPAGLGAYDSRISKYYTGGGGGPPLVFGQIPIAGAFSAFLQSPCAQRYEISSGAQPVSDNTPETVDLPQVTLAVVSELTDDGTLANYNAAIADAGAYTYWQLDSQYYTNQMRAHCPIAQTSGGSQSSSQQNTSVVVNLAPAQTKRIIRVVAERIGVLPTLPQPTDTFTDENGIQCTLLENNLVGSAPIRTPDNKQIFRVQGEITYALLRAISPNSTLRLGFNSWETLQPVYKMVFPEAASGVG